MNKFRDTFLKGLFAILPITATLYLLIWLIKFAENFFGPWIRSIIPNSFYVPGMGVILGCAFIFIVGFLLNAWLAQKIFDWFESFLNRLPLIKTIYKPLKDLMGFFAGQKSSNLNRVVLAEIQPGKKVLGLVTRENFEDLPKEIGNKDDIIIYIPLSYQIGGLSVILPKDQVTEVDMSVERALSLTVTGWMGPSSK